MFDPWITPYQESCFRFVSASTNTKIMDQFLVEKLLNKIAWNLSEWVNSGL